MAGTSPNASKRPSQKSDGTEATQVGANKFKKARLPGIIKYGSFKEAFAGIANETDRLHNQAVKEARKSHAEAVSRVTGGRV